MQSAIELLIRPRSQDLGGFTVRRLLPYARRRQVGPFTFFDHMGPADFAPGTGADVAPHPHIGLATVTYLFEGEFLHRDSLGTVQTIRPGDVNWMSAGRGIVHSERTPPERRQSGGRVHGIQSWVALPQTEEQDAPSFQHHPAASLPAFAEGGAHLVLIAGTAYGRRSPVRVSSPCFYLEARLDDRAILLLSDEHEQRAVYVVEGQARLEEHPLQAGDMAVLATGGQPCLKAAGAARIMLLGGAALDGPRHIWWNFVSSSPARIEQAKQDWAARRFAPIPGEHGFVPLPRS